MGHRSYARKQNGRFTKQSSLEEMGLVRPHDYKADGSWCGAINPWTHQDEKRRPVLPTICRCGESLIDSDGRVLQSSPRTENPNE